MLDKLPVFVGITFLILVIPGPDFVLVTRNTVAGVRSNGYMTAAGICASLTIFAFLTAVGVSSVIARDGAIMSAFRIVGGVYLVFLAGQIAVGMRSSRGDSGNGTAGGVARLGSPAAQGFINNILNPKAIVFFLAFLPQFVGRGHSVFYQTLLLGMIVVGCAVAWWTCYVTAIGYLGEVMKRPRVRVTIDACACVALSVFGLLVIFGLF